MNFATERTKWEELNSRLANLSMDVDDCDQRSRLQANTASSTTFYATSIRICFMKWKDAVISLPSAELEPVWLASESATSVAFGISSFTVLD